MTFNVDPNNLLEDVHPDLVKVIKASSQEPVNFIVVYGIRTEEAEKKAVATGHSQSMHSRHLPQSHEDNKSCAIDFCVTDVNGKLDWTVSSTDGGNFGKAAQQIKSAAAKLNVPIEWGGDKVGAWAPGVISHFRDWGHIQLPWREYP